MTPNTDIIYHHVFKRCFSFSDRLVIALVNSCFSTHHPPDSQVDCEFAEGIVTPFNQLWTRIMITINGTQCYHLFLQLRQTGRGLFPIFNCDYQHILLNTSPCDPHITFPEPVIIYLADESHLPDTYDLNVHIGSQNNICCHIPIYNFSSMTLLEIADAGMIILLPFYILKLHDQIIENHSPKALNELKHILLNDIPDIFYKQLSAGLLSVNEILVLQNQLLELYDFFYSDFTNEYILIDIFTYKIVKGITQKITAEITQEMSTVPEKETEAANVG